MGILGYLLLRNCSAWMCDRHSAFLEFVGLHTLEAYLLQFHVLMSRECQHIIVLLPNAGADGSDVMRALNMLLVGSIYVFTVMQARTATVATQSCLSQALKALTTGQWTVKSTRGAESGPNMFQETPSVFNARALRPP